jgi:16S rRNA (cytosine1402-N4)-methyltransferase
VQSHRPVMLSEVLSALDVREGHTVIDATFGRGGHARALAERVGRSGRVLALDRDPAAIAAGAELALPQLELVHARFSALGEVAEARGLLGAVAGVVMDLGVSSPQLDAAERGFSFLHDGPLDMRMDPAVGQSAREWLARASVEEIADVFRRYGEERFARRIARAIVEARAGKPLERTVELAEIVARAHPRWERDRHPATRVFQAIRIHVNDELGELEQALTHLETVLALGGRAAVISFHSLEDRIVKRAFRGRREEPESLRKLPLRAGPHEGALKPLGRPRRPSVPEVRANPRARSARLRVAERVR